VAAVGKIWRRELLAGQPTPPSGTHETGKELISESLAICQWLNTQHNGTLIPAADDPALFLYLRWSVYLVAAIYPTFFYGDHPERRVSSEQSRKELRSSTDEARKKMWLQMEESAKGDHGKRSETQFRFQSISVLKNVSTNSHLEHMLRSNYPCYVDRN
jgi:hypothetical protein